MCIPTNKRKTGNYRSGVSTKSTSLVKMTAVMRIEAESFVEEWPLYHPLCCLLCSSLISFSMSRAELHSDLSKGMAGHVFMFILCWSQNDDWWLATGSLTLQSHTQSQSVLLSSNFKKNSLIVWVLRNLCFLTSSSVLYYKAANA